MIAGTGNTLLPVLTPEKPASTNPANETARELTGRDYISWSAISTFRTCPLKYKFRYIDGLPEESVSSALVFGTGIHTAVEQHFQAILSGDPKPDLDALLFAYRSAWLPHDPDAIQFGSTETRASLDALAARMLTAFLASPTASVQGRVLGVEEEIRGMLVEGVPDLYGRVDLLTEDADTLCGDRHQDQSRKMVCRAGRGQRRAVVAVQPPRSRDQPREEGRDTVLGPDEDQGPGHRGACAGGRASRREAHLGGRGAGLAGDRVRCVLSGAQHDELLDVWLSGGVSGVGGVRNWRPGLLSSGHAPAAFFTVEATCEISQSTPTRPRQS
jgi:hypothetical protein